MAKSSRSHFADPYDCRIEKDVIGIMVYNPLTEAVLYVYKKETCSTVSNGPL